MFFILLSLQYDKKLIKFYFSVNKSKNVGKIWFKRNCQQYNNPFNISYIFSYTYKKTDIQYTYQKYRPICHQNDIQLDRYIDRQIDKKIDDRYMFR